ncbi:MAG: DUF423 domain-containing protein [Thermoguttaceae bacterium]|jgi:uncharacterized membrane protein YgdD (TMEM256/DUF423 family)
MDARTWIIVGSILGGLGVAAGAFGAHGLQGKLSPAALLTYEVAVRYQLFHALALVLVGMLALAHPSLASQVAGWAFLAGILIFSGFLYGYVFTGIRVLAIPVPIGGVAFLVGWAALAIAGWNLPRGA